jgi:Bacterial regulatory proteins, gntR family
MDRDWNDAQTIYRQLRARIVVMILEGSIAAEYRINPLTVLKGYQQLVDDELVEVKRGRGMFIHAGARTAAPGRARKVHEGRVAQGPRHDSAPRPERGGAPQPAASGAPLESNPMRRACIEVSGLRKTYGSVAAVWGRPGVRIGLGLTAAFPVHRDPLRRDREPNT